MKQDSAVGRAIKTVIQVVIGLFAAVWAVPGVPQAVTNYVNNNVVQVLLIVGLPAGVVTFIWNFFRKDVPNI